MIFGMPTLIELNDLENTMMLCNELGLSFVELNMNLPQYQLEELKNFDRLLELSQKYNVNYTIHLDENLNFCDFNKAVADAYMRTVKNSITIAKMLNVPVLNMHMNHGVHFTLPDRKVQLFEQYNEDYMNSIKAFRHMCEQAIGESDIKISIENTDGYRAYEKTAVKHLLESKVFALTWDIGHSNSCGNIDESFIIENQHKLYHFHIHDSLGNKDHMTLGTGEVDLAHRLALADKHNCRCVIEIKIVDSLRKSVDWLIENSYL